LIRFHQDISAILLKDGSLELNDPHICTWRTSSACQLSRSMLDSKKAIRCSYRS